MIMLICIKDTLKAFSDFKNKQRSVRRNALLYVEVSIFWKCIQYTIYWDKTQILNKLPLDKINGTKMPSFFFLKPQLMAVLLLNCDSCMSSSTGLVCLKLCVGFSIFDSVSLLLQFTFFNKMHGLFDFKMS